MSNTALAPDLYAGFVTMRDAVTLFPTRGGRHVNYQTIRLWTMSGLRAPNGEMVRLQSHRIGSRILTKAEWITQFLDAIQVQVEMETATAE